MVTLTPQWLSVTEWSLAYLLLAGNVCVEGHLQGINGWERERERESTEESLGRGDGGRDS